MQNRPILVVGPLGEGALAQSYARAFERLGMEVVRFDSDLALKRASRPAANRIFRRALRGVLWNRVNREVADFALTVRPSLIFAVKCSFLHSETVQKIRKHTGVPFVNHYPDNPYIGIRWSPREASALRRDLIEVLGQYSIVWMWERGLMNRLREDGVDARYLPFAVDPELSRPQNVPEGFNCEQCNREHDIAFVATYSRARCAELKAIRKHRVAIWGSNWPKEWTLPSGQHQVHEQLWGPGVGNIYARARLSLNVLNAENLQGPNMRTFEIPGSGGVMLARYSDAQNEFFPEGEAAAYYRSPEDLDEQIARVLGDRSLRERLRRNGVRIAAGHSYDARAATVLRECGLDVARSLTH